MLPSFQFALVVRIDCSIKVYNLATRRREGTFYPDEIEIQEARSIDS